MAYFVTISMPTMLSPMPLIYYRDQVPATDASRYRAILDAADHIEAHPDSFDYQTVSMNEPTACILGWIGRKHGGAFLNADAVAGALLGLTPTHFFYEMGRLMLGRDPNWHSKRDYACLYRAESVVQALRRFADRYRPKHIGLPACVTDIFTERDALATT